MVGRPHPLRRGNARGRRLRDRTSRASSRSPAGCCVRTGAPSRSSRRSSVDAVADGSARAPRGARGRRRRPGARAARRSARRPRRAARRARSRRSASASSRRSSRTCSPRAATSRDARPRRRRPRGALLDPARGAAGHLSLLNLVNFGGGCYTVYAEVDEDTGDVRVDKELYGDVFRRPPKLTPLEARAIRLAIEYVGPTIAAEAAHAARPGAQASSRRPSGSSSSPTPPTGSPATPRRSSCGPSRDAVEKHRVVEIEYLKEGEESPDDAIVEPYSFERELPVLARAHLGPDGRRIRGRTGSTACARHG